LYEPDKHTSALLQLGCKQILDARKKLRYWKFMLE